MITTQECDLQVVFFSTGFAQKQLKKQLDLKVKQITISEEIYVMVERFCDDYVDILKIMFKTVKLNK